MKVRVASAGTGKTTSLVLRYLDLVASGTPLRRVAGVTFTRTAADELRQRVGVGVQTMLEQGTYLHARLLEPQRPLFEEAQRELGGATLTTIHGFMTEALRLGAPTMGLDPAFKTLGEWEAQALFEEELNSLLYLASAPEHGLYAACETLGDDARALLLTLFKQRSLTERYASDEHPKHRALQGLFEAVYKRFELRLGATLLPPSETERRALKLVRTPKALARLAGRYQTVLVDEFQDVNPLQGAFFEALEQGGLNLEVVGDPKQSIYGFRNADVGVFRRALAGGERLEPLTHTRRHAPLLARFLNHLTATLAERGMGFGQGEAPPVSPTGEQEGAQGRVELHWVCGDAAVSDLRAHEAQVLVARLQALHERGHSYSDMAVLARAYAGLAQVETALLAAELPYVLLQGRGYYARLEVRDLYHALRVGVEPVGLSLGVWLRGPFGQLGLAEVDAVLKADAPLDTLEQSHPEVFERLELTAQQVRGTPLAALKFLIREPFIGGKRYVDFLETRARENVDALLFAVAQAPPGDIELLLERLDLLSRQGDAGDVPQSGEGVQLLTIHRAKGLEWPIVALYDLNRTTYHPPQKVYVHPQTGHLCCENTDTFESTRDALKAREEDEAYRLLYVAASRPRNVLLMTGSVKGGKCDGFAKALEAMNLGPGSKAYRRDDFVLQNHVFAPVVATSNLSPQTSTVTPAPYIDRRFRLHEHPPVSSPSRLKREGLEHEPLPFSDPDEGERLPGHAAAVGTLLHYGVSQNWRADNPTHLQNLRAQEVMFPFTPPEQDDILQEVTVLLHNYEQLLGAGIAALHERSHDYPELGMALPVGTTVWQGVIDRLYCAHSVWYLEDYKTDRDIVPEKYHFQLAVYLRAIEEVRGVVPEVRLVFLREKVVYPVAKEDLRTALEAQFSSLSISPTSQSPVLRSVAE